MSDKPVSTDPGYVMIRFGMLMMVLAMLFGGGIIGAITLSQLVVESKLTFFLLAGITGVPFLTGLALVSKWFRGALLEIAHRLPFVNFQKPEPPANG